MLVETAYHKVLQRLSRSCAVTKRHAELQVSFVSTRRNIYLCFRADAVGAINPNVLRKNSALLVELHVL